MSIESETRIQGVAISPGIGIGTAYKSENPIEARRVRIPRRLVAREQTRYSEALRSYREHLHAHVEKVHSSSYLETDQILKFHELILQDEQFHHAVLEKIAENLVNAEWALMEESKRVIEGLVKSGDEYFRARSEDILDMTYNIVSELSTVEGETPSNRESAGEGHIIVTNNLFVSEVMEAHKRNVGGFVTESGALTAHAAILLKSYNIPSVGAAKDIVRLTRPDGSIIADGIRGIVIVNPSPNTIKKYRTARTKLSRETGRLPYPLISVGTRDGTAVNLLASIDHSDQIDYIRRNGLADIGLFRTEFLAISAERIPGEEEQYEVYKQVMEKIEGRRVVFRTFDFGGDKYLPVLERCVGRNPALGMRGIRRHLFLHPEELRVQLSALLRAGKGRVIDILIPLVTKADEVVRVKAQLDIARKELLRRGKPIAERLRLGAMIEVPAAAFAVRELLSEADFIHVGTNDLLQYFMAADRDNEAIMKYYGDLCDDSFRSLLRLIISRAAEIGRENDVSVCGEIASSPEHIPMLLGMGYRSFSISPFSARSVRHAIESFSAGNDRS